MRLANSPTALADHHIVRWRQLGNTFVDAPGRWDAIVSHVQRQGIAIHLTPPVRMRCQSLEFGAEQERIAATAIVERLLAHAVPG
jgi:extradiol dioxygenase family protein